MARTENSLWLQEIFQRFPDGIVALARDGSILSANPAFARLFGIAPEDAVGKKIPDLVPGEQRDKWTHDINKVLHNEWTLAEDTSLQANGRQIPTQISVLTRTIYDGQDAVVLHIRDISVFHTVEHALAVSEDQWERSFDAITDYMCLLNRSGRILRANRTMTQRFQPQHGNLIGQNYQDIFECIRHPGTKDACNIINDTPLLVEEMTFPGINGWFCVSAYPLRNEENALTGAILIAKDITEAYKMKEALKKNEIGLRQAAKMEAIGRLAGGIAHDFNNMLTSILGYSSLIFRNLKEDDPLQKDLQEIIRATERATTITRQLLDFSHERALETKVIQLNTVIENIERFLRRTIGEDIKLVTRLEPKLGNIRADISRLEQIIVNLAINARDAMPKGGQLIIETSNHDVDNSFCRIHPEITPGRYVLLEVSDTGHGMPPAVLEHIFEPFFTTKEKGKGTGLGLTTIYAIVRQFNGCISCYSVVNGGTTFKIYLPLCRETQVTAEDIIPETALPNGDETILVVDDEANIVAMISQFLKELGYQVLAADNSAKALQLSDQHPGTIDLVLTDVIMPELCGTDLIKQLVRKRPNLKALFMSGYANSIALQTGGLRLDDICLQKPFSLQTLALRVRKALDSSGGTPGPEQTRHPDSS